MFHTFCVCFKLLKLNFLEYCVFDTMHYLIYDNFDQVYGFWEIGGLVCKKMLAYRPRKPWSEKNNSTLSPRDFFLCVCVFFFFLFFFFRFSDMTTAKKKAPFPKRTLLGNFENCLLSWHWFWKASYCDTLKLNILTFLLTLQYSVNHSENWHRKSNSWKIDFCLLVLEGG